MPLRKEFGAGTPTRLERPSFLLPPTSSSIGDILDRTVGNRYAMPGTSQWESDHRLIPPVVISPLHDETYEGQRCLDGIGVLLAYWWAIMDNACELRWEDSRCAADERLAADPDEAWELVERAIRQMLRGVSVMTSEELRARRMENRKNAARPKPLPVD